MNDYIVCMGGVDFSLYGKVPPNDSNVHNKIKLYFAVISRWEKSF